MIPVRLSNCSLTSYWEELELAPIKTKAVIFPCLLNVSHKRLDAVSLDTHYKGVICVDESVGGPMWEWSFMVASEISNVIKMENKNGDSKN